MYGRKSWDGPVDPYIDVKFMSNYKPSDAKDPKASMIIFEWRDKDFVGIPSPSGYSKVRLTQITPSDSFVTETDTSGVSDHGCLQRRLCPTEQVQQVGDRRVHHRRQRDREIPLAHPHKARRPQGPQADQVPYQEDGLLLLVHRAIHRQRVPSCDGMAQRLWRAIGDPDSQVAILRRHHGRLRFAGWVLGLSLLSASP